MSLGQQRTRTTDLQTFRGVLNANEGPEDEPVYHQTTGHPVQQKHIGQDSVQDTQYSQHS